MTIEQRNPYDFAHAVVNPKLFAGRTDQLTEIDYYLQQALVVDRPVNIALVGPGAAGKTSLLNMAVRRAAEIGLHPVRIDLTDDDTRSSLTFLARIYDAVFTLALTLGSYGGVGGPAHLKYIESVLGARLPSEPIEGLVFPMLYANAASSQNFDAPITDTVLWNDLEHLQRAVGGTIVVVLDECDGLAQRRAILEKLRNTFQHLKSYMLFIAGTPELFIKIDEVFAPAARLFRKIVVDAFGGREETERCMFAPLEAAGVDPTGLWDFSQYPANVAEIHAVTGGRPHEIQRLCHVMFRRVQLGQTPRMQLDLDVLEDVRRQIEQEGRIGDRPIINAIRSLDKQGLRALGALVACDGGATLDQLWSIEYLLNGLSQWTKEDMRFWLDRLVAAGILGLTGSNQIKFAGDNSDRVYATYLGREHKVVIAFPPLAEPPIELYLFVSLLGYLVDRGCMAIGMYRTGNRAVELSDQALIHVQTALAGLTDDQTILQQQHKLAVDLHSLATTHRDQENVELLRAHVRLGSIEGVALYLPSRNLDENELNIVSVRAREIGGDVRWERLELPLYGLESIVSAIERSNNHLLRRELAGIHAGAALHAYLEHHDLDEAGFHARLVYRYGADLPPSLMNNVGYILLVAGERARAQSLFDQASRASDGDSRIDPLVTYNRAICLAQTGDFESALDLLEGCVNRLQALDEEGRRMSFLLIGSRESGALRFTEARDPDLLAATRQTSAAISEALNDMRSKLSGK